MNEQKERRNIFDLVSTSLTLFSFNSSSFLDFSVILLLLTLILPLNQSIGDEFPSLEKKKVDQLNKALRPHHSPLASTQLCLNNIACSTFSYLPRSFSHALSETNVKKRRKQVYTSFKVVRRPHHPQRKLFPRSCYIPRYPNHYCFQHLNITNSKFASPWNKPLPYYKTNWSIVNFMACWGVHGYLGYLGKRKDRVFRGRERGIVRFGLCLEITCLLGLRFRTFVTIL